mgnify:CR=1 FL=1
MSFLSRLFPIERNPLDIHAKELATINSQKEEIELLTEEQIKVEVKNFQTELKGITDNQKLFKRLIEIRPRVFALTREASKRTIGQFHYDVQLVGGMVLSSGQIAEMKTGEGKTLTATLPLVLFALAGRGAHLVTVNDYLARWQASLMGPIFRYLGLTAASIQHEQSFLYDPNYQPEQTEIDQLESETQGLVMDVKHMRPTNRREAYAADITYGTNNEFGFDYLRDNMVQRLEQLVQRDLFYAIVDEVDSILVDEARTPLIISAPDTEPTSKYVDFARMVDGLQETTHYIVDEKHKAATLTDDGVSRVEELLNVPNIYDTSKGVTTLHHIEQGLRAKTLYQRDRDYVIRDGEIIIVDEFTGRLMFGRRYSEGLHQAIEAKESVKIQQESKTLATITFQNLFRLYARLSGMTGTAKTEEEEFFKIYQLTVVPIPTNRVMVRVDSSDIIYKNEDAKFKAIAKEVKERQSKGQPVLIGTVSIAKNEILAEHLKKEGVRFEMLNAKNHEREAQIISQAGRYGAVTLATNIAGRGVDILLGGNPIDKEEAERVREAGGLHVLGTERHESRRIDNQLRGRAGRQGDPGSSQFFVSMDDDLLRLFGGDRMKSMMNTLGIKDDEPIEARLVSRSIEQAQKKIEGLNFDTRKHVLEFDDVLNRQRNIIYKRRRRYLTSVNNELAVVNGEESKNIAEETEESEEAEQEFGVREEILDLMKKEISEIITFTLQSTEDADEAFKVILETTNAILPVTDKVKENVTAARENAADREFAVIDELYKAGSDYFEVKEKEIGAETYAQICRFIILQAIDTFWMEHLDTMDHLRDSVRLRGYGQRDPLVEYKREGFKLFERMIVEINKQVIYSVLKVSVQAEQQVQAQAQALPTNLVTNLSDGSGSTSQPGSGEKQPGRNDPCPCGSGKKYKKCGLINTSEHNVLMAKKQ